MILRVIKEWLDQHDYHGGSDMPRYQLLEWIRSSFPNLDAEFMADGLIAAGIGCEKEQAAPLDVTITNTDHQDQLLLEHAVNDLTYIAFYRVGKKNCYIRADRPDLHPKTHIKGTIYVLRKKSLKWLPLWHVEIAQPINLLDTNWHQECVKHLLAAASAALYGSPVPLMDMVPRNARAANTDWIFSPGQKR